MNSTTYWHKQSQANPLYKDFEWNRPERISERGKLGIIGGQASGFLSVAGSYKIAKENEVGQIRVLLPDILKKSIPISADDVRFTKTSATGGLSIESLDDLIKLSNWADVCLMIGDAGKSSETSICYENMMSNTEKPLLITRDSFDLLIHSTNILLNRNNTALVLSFAQLQKLFKSSYYPIVLSFNSQLTQVVEALHKFTITYPLCVSVFHQSNIIIAYNGEVTTTRFENPLDIWRGVTATKMAINWTYKTKDPLQCFTAAVV